MPGRADGGCSTLGDIFGKGLRPRARSRRKMTVAESHRVLGSRRERQAAGSGEMVVRESDHHGRAKRHRLLSTRSTRSAGRGRAARRRRARMSARERGAARPLAADRRHHRSRTKHGAVKTDHILFIALGVPSTRPKPSDLLPELQGRLPIRVELKAPRPRRLPAHPDRARGEPDQAIQGIARDRGASSSTSTKPRSTRLALLAEEIKHRGREYRGRRRLHTILERLVGGDQLQPLSDRPEGTLDRNRSELCPRQGPGRWRRTPTLSRFIL